MVRSSSVTLWPSCSSRWTRWRVSTDDWERLGLFPGQQIRVVGTGVDGNFLLASVAEEPPLVWLRFRLLASRVAG